MDPEQARIIVRAVDGLPPGVDAADRERAEKHLVHLAGEHDAVVLRRLARRLHEVIDPDAADEAEGRRLEAEESAAARSTYLHLMDNGDGTHAGRFRIPTRALGRLRDGPAAHRQGPVPSTYVRARGQVDVFSSS